MKDSDGSERIFRSKLAKMTLLLGVGGVLILSATTIVLARADDRDRTTQLIFSSVLPLLGTWVGTVLAFYFARENFDAATESTYRLTRPINGETLVAEVMIPRSQMIVRRVDKGSDVSAIQLRSINDAMKYSGKRRVPLLSADEVVEYVIHSSLLDSFGREIGKADFDEETVADLIAVSECRDQAKSLGFVSEESTIEQSRAKMESITGCNDIFVTPTGDCNERVTGWLTNSLLATID